MKNFLNACYRSNFSMFMDTAVKDFGGVWEEAVSKGYVEKRTIALVNAMAIQGNYREITQLDLTDLGRHALHALP